MSELRGEYGGDDVETTAEHDEQETAREANEHHAPHVADDVKTYAKRMYGLAADREDYPTVLSDMLADMLHFGRTKGVDPEEVIRMARYHFEAEEEDGE